MNESSAAEVLAHDEGPTDVMACLTRLAAGMEHGVRVSERAPELWQALAAGRWAIIERLDTPDRRLLAVRPVEPGVRSGRLSKQERRVAVLAASGQSLKVVAFELGLSAPAVSRHLSSALPKLGLRDRLELAHLLGTTRAPELECGRDSFPAPTGLLAHVVEAANDELVVLSFALCEPAPPSGLSLAEREVVRLVSRGLTNAEIARQRTTSVRTVANQLSSVFGKLHVGSRVELVMRSVHLAAHRAAV